MVTQQGDVALLNDLVAQRLLNAPLLARLAYNWHDGTPRVVPIWFHWSGEEIVMGGPPDAPKVDALRERPDVAITIDDDHWPYKVLLVRGRANVEVVDGITPEYKESARKHFGEEQGTAWVSQVGQTVSRMSRIAVRPTWVAILDFETRFPSALAKRMGASSA
jgi:nitroimidazol reductase NimA-like FMN-containing flavoprotein (pyridoxamine 5'-phosphate oxidase superfamily)